jgi:hypothetical protein
MPLKTMKNGMKVWVRPTKCERAYLTASRSRYRRAPKRRSARHLPEDALRVAGCYVVDPSYIGGIVEAIKADGLSVS